MVDTFDVFQKEICNYCKETSCNQNIKINKSNDLITYFCDDYKKEKSSFIKDERILFSNK